MKKHLNVSVTLCQGEILSFIKQMHGSIPINDTEVAPVDLSTFDLGKSIRGNNFRVIHSLLLNPLREMLSTSPPDFNTLSNDASEQGFIVIYGASSNDYLEDGISWTVQTKMNLKLILYDTEKKMYKVKNSKNDIGDIMMRRQTWSVADGSGWYRNEYKLFQEEVIYRKNIDGSITQDTKRVLNKHPVVVHYFRKKGNYTIPRKRQKVDIDSPSDNTDLIPQGVYDGFVENTYNTCQTPEVFYPETGLLNVVSFAPNFGFSKEYTKVIVVLDPKYDLYIGDYHCYFNGVDIAFNVLSRNAFDFIAPPHNSATIVEWSVIAKVQDNLIESSPQMIFYYLPSDTQGKLSMAFTLIEPYQNEAVLAKFKYIVTDLNLSYNNLSNIYFLREFKFLKSLTLDNNNLTEWTQFPHFPELETLSINTNLISTIEMFCDTLTKSCPKLRFLSMLGNDACPIFSTLPHHYYNFRIYVISRIKDLHTLDSSIVTDEERRHALCITSPFLPQFE